MFQARSEWRHIRLIFDHAEGLLIRFTYSFRWVLYSNYHNCSAKHVCLYVRWWEVRVCHETEIPVPKPINIGWMAGYADKEERYWYERRKKRKGREEWAWRLAQPTANDRESVHLHEAPWNICQAKKCLCHKFIHLFQCNLSLLDKKIFYQ